MKNYLAGVFALLLCSTFSFAQNTDSSRISIGVKPQPQDSVLLIVDEKEIGKILITSSGQINSSSDDDLFNIDFDNISAIAIYKGSDAVRLYGSKAKNGAIIITTRGLSNEKGNPK
jgi:outer membrane receptor protein involved in Fe transport